MSALLTNHSFLSSLKRNRAVRNRGNNETPASSKHTNRLPVLPEHVEEDGILGVFLGHGFSSSLPPPLPSRSTTPKEKRLRSGKDGSAVRGASPVTNDSPSARPLIPSRDPSSSIKRMHRSVRLSTFDMIIDIPPSEPVSPVSETSSAPYTPPCPRGQRPSPLDRTRSPTPSLTSMSACSSTDMPRTPGGSDDEWPSPPTSHKSVARPPISTHPYAISKSTLIPQASTEDSMEFTLESFFPLGPEDEESEEEDEEDDDDVLWYSRELGEVIALSFPDVPSNCPARPESLLSLPRSSRRRSNRLPGRSRMSKPLPDLPRVPGPSSQMDPTFPRSKPRPPPPMPLPPSPTSATHPLRLSPPAPAAATPLASTSSPNSGRRPLSIVVPRALPRTSLPLDVADILDDIDAWSFGTPSSSSSTGTQTLSPPRVPSSAIGSSSPFSTEYDPIELVVSYAASQPASPSPSSSPSSTPTHAFPPSGTASFLEEGDIESDWGATEGEDRLRSRWSCSTLATLAAASSGSPPSTPTTTSARLRMHLGSVARLVRTRRVGRSNGCEDPVAAVPKAVTGATHLRCASESALSGTDVVVVAAAATEGEAPPRSGLQRKPIPLELFSRSQKAF